jgi:hypothetical protein
MKNVENNDGFGVAITEARWQFGASGVRELQPFEAWKPLPSNGTEDVTVDNNVCA